MDAETELRYATIRYLQERIESLAATLDSAPLSECWAIALELTDAKNVLTELVRDIDMESLLTYLLERWG